MAAPDFVGREREMLVLRRQLDRALAGEPETPRPGLYR
jgi:hypothetical protein